MSYCEIDVLDFDHLCAERDFVTDKQNSKDEKADVTCEKVARVPIDKYCEATGEKNQNGEEEAKP